MLTMRRVKSCQRYGELDNVNYDFILRLLVAIRDGSVDHKLKPIIIAIVLKVRNVAPKAQDYLVAIIILY